MAGDWMAYTIKIICSLDNNPIVANWFLDLGQTNRHLRIFSIIIIIIKCSNRKIVMSIDNEFSNKYNNGIVYIRDRKRNSPSASGMGIRPLKQGYDKLQT